MLNITGRYLYFTIICVLFIYTNLLYAKEMYKWTDVNGTVHITDKKSEIPPDIPENLEKLLWNNEESENYQNEEIDDGSFQYTPPHNYVDSIVDTEYEKELKKKWSSMAKEIEDRKAEIDYKLQIAKQNYMYKKKELEYLLVEGYMVGTRITELRNLERYIQELEQEQKEIAPQLDILRTQARKAGIPEGYLRP